MFSLCILFYFLRKLHDDWIFWSIFFCVSKSKKKSWQDKCEHWYVFDVGSIWFFVYFKLEFSLGDFICSKTSVSFLQIFLRFQLNLEKLKYLKHVLDLNYKLYRKSWHFVESIDVFKDFMSGLGYPAKSDGWERVNWTLQLDFFSDVSMDAYWTRDLKDWSICKCSFFIIKSWNVDCLELRDIISCETYSLRWAQIRLLGMFLYFYRCTFQRGLVEYFSILEKLKQCWLFFRRLNDKILVNIAIGKINKLISLISISSKNQV